MMGQPRSWLGLVVSRTVAREEFGFVCIGGASSSPCLLARGVHGRLSTTYVYNHCARDTTYV